MARWRVGGNLLASLVVAGTVAAIAFGLPLIDRRLDPDRPAGSAPMAVGAGVTVVPPPGAVVDVTATRPARDQGTALLLVGDVRLALVVVAHQGDLGAAADTLRATIGREKGARLTGDTAPTATGAGVAGVGGGYTTPGRAGRYAVFVQDGRAVQVTASGPDGGVTPVLAAAVRSLTFGPHP